MFAQQAKTYVLIQSLSLGFILKFLCSSLMFLFSIILVKFQVTHCGFKADSTLYRNFLRRLSQPSAPADIWTCHIGKCTSEINDINNGSVALSVRSLQ